MSGDKKDVSKDLSIGMLLDYYGFILTKKQVSVLNMYYNEDMSLSEIAEESGITRQAALDFIKRGSDKLTKLEDELKLAKKFGVVSQALRDAKDFCQTEGNAELTQKIDSALKTWEEL